MSNQDFYNLLGVSRSASDSEIKKAYLKLAKQYHPDRNPGDKESERKFKEINHAYDILKDSQKRSAYDSMGHAAFESGGGNYSSGFRSQEFRSASGMDDIFGDFFSDFMGGRSKRKTRTRKIRGSDLKYNMTISLEEAFKGVDKKINFSTQVKCDDCQGYGSKDKNDVGICSQCHGEGSVRIQQGFFTVEQTCNKCTGSGQFIKTPCSKCNGYGRHDKQKYLVVNIPSGVENNTRIRVSGEGECGIRGGSSGDLYLFVSINPHNIYKVEGSDLHFKLPISFTKASLGCEVEVPTIDGSRVQLKIPAGTDNGDKLRLSGKGMSKIRSSVRGDLYAHAFINTPKNLTKKQKQLMEELDKELGNSNIDYKHDGFFSRMKNIWS